MSKKTSYKSPKMRIANDIFVLVDLINSEKLLMVFSYYSTILNDRHIIEGIKTINIWL